jgi:hypothetical protein
MRLRLSHVAKKVFHMEHTVTIFMTVFLVVGKSMLYPRIQIVRKLPPHRRFLIAAGLDHALSALESFHFDTEDLRYLESLELFRSDYLDYLAELRFRGEVYAVTDGTPVFPNQPLLEVAAPLPQAQQVETLLINQIHLPTPVASKTVLLVQAADGRCVGDLITLYEQEERGEPLLQHVMSEGRRLSPEAPDLQRLRDQRRERIASLPPGTQRRYRIPGYHQHTVATRDTAGAGRSEDRAETGTVDRRTA